MSPQSEQVKDYLGEGKGDEAKRRAEEVRR